MEAFFTALVAFYSGTEAAPFQTVWKILGFLLSFLNGNFLQCRHFLNDFDSQASLCMMPYNKEEIIMNDTTTVPISEKYVLTIKEASCFFCIGENKLRRLAAERTTARWVVMNGNRILIKRCQFEKFLDSTDVI